MRDGKHGVLRLTYDGKILFEGYAPGAALSSSISRQQQAVTQTITLTPPQILPIDFPA